MMRSTRESVRTLLAAVFGRDQVAPEPVPGQTSDLFKGARFGKEVSGAGNDNQLLDAWQSLQSLLVELDNDVVVAAHDQEGRRPHRGEVIAREVRPAAA